VLVDYQAEYDNRRRVPEYEAISRRWAERSRAYRETATVELGLPYGRGERHRFDLYRCGVVNAPLVVYLHGGYWQWGDRALYGFLAESLNAAEIDVAIPSYPLCPAATVLEIIRDIRGCLVAIWRFTAVRPLVVGHSAGGQLAASMLASDWSRILGAPDDFVLSAVAVSGVFDLEPLIETTINDALNLDSRTARMASPRNWPVPVGRRLLAVVGAEESSEFRWQARDIVDVWGGAGVRTDFLEVEAANHFTVVDELARIGSQLNLRVIDLACDLNMAG
jgi:arylformamidase